MSSQPLPGPELVADPIPAVKQVPPKPQKALPSDRVTITKQLEILRGYAVASNQGTKPVGNRDVATLITMTPESISACNGFLSSVGLIQKSEGSAWIISPEVLAFFRAYEWNKETAAHKLAPLVQSAWFGQALLPKLSFKPLAEDEAIAILADLSVAGPEYRKSLKMLLEFMEATGTIQRDGNQLMLRSLVQSSNPEVRPSEPKSDHQAAEVSPTRSAKVSTAFSQMAEGAMRFNVSFTVDMAEMSNWRADRIAAFFAGIAQVLAAKAEVEKTARD